MTAVHILTHPSYPHLFYGCFEPSLEFLVIRHLHIHSITCIADHPVWRTHPIALLNKCTISTSCMTCLS